MPTSSTGAPTLQSWFSKNFPPILLSLAMTAGGFLVGQARGDATQDAKIEALALQVKDVSTNKVSREEFAQFTRSVESQLQMINDNLMALRREQRERGR